MMTQFLPAINFASSLVFFLALSFYVITCFQWFSYRASRVIFHFTRPIWHVFFAIIPAVLYYTSGEYFGIYLVFAYLPALFLWHKKLDKKLVFTARIKRFFAFSMLAFVFYSVLFFILHQSLRADAILPLIAGLVFSDIYERFLMARFRSRARKKLSDMSELRVILITASYGKTSMKNFLYELLKDSFICYKTPRSINTEGGIIKDINENLPTNTQIYIAEAGAREPGDISTLAALLEPEIVIVGEIGSAHLEYFKNIETTRNTKLEALSSKRLKKAFLHSSTLKQEDEIISIYNSNISNIIATLDGIKFNMGDKTFNTPLLGEFHSENLAAVISVAKYLGVDDDSISMALSRLKNPDHRLSKIEANAKLIIDDSFNGNINGMCASYKLASTYDGTKVLITPGIVEGGADDNARLAKVANEIFDVVLITGALNAPVLLKYLTKPKVVIVKDKSELTNLLVKHTKPGDLILFSNDAPSFI